MAPSLLLLPFPPQPLSPDLISIAYRPSIEATLLKLANPSGPSTLIIVVPHDFLIPSQHTPSSIPTPRRTSNSKPTQFISFPQTQALLSSLYTLVSYICAAHSIPSELNGGPGSIDTRILLLHHPRSSSNPFPGPPKIDTENNVTTIIDLPTFAVAYRPWNKMFHVASEAGTLIFKRFCDLAEWKQTLHLSSFVEVTGGVVMRLGTGVSILSLPGTVTTSLPAPPEPGPQPTPGHPVVCLGGTFDYLHPGHKLLLSAGVHLLHVPEPPPLPSTAFSSPFSLATEPSPPVVPARFVIGITGDALLINKAYASEVQPWTVRARNVLDFLATLLELSPDGFIPLQVTEGETPPTEPTSTTTSPPKTMTASFRQGLIVAECVEINDPYGPTVTDPSITALVVSGETKDGGISVLEKRKSVGLGDLELFVVGVLGDQGAELEQDGGGENGSAGWKGKISSSGIRERRVKSREPGGESGGSKI